MESRTHKSFGLLWLKSVKKIQSKLGKVLKKSSKAGYLNGDAMEEQQQVSILVFCTMCEKSHITKQQNNQDTWLSLKEKSKGES